MAPVVKETCVLSSEGTKLISLCWGVEGGVKTRKDGRGIEVTNERWREKDELI